MLNAVTQLGDVQSLILELQDTEKKCVRFETIEGVPHLIKRDGYSVAAHPDLLAQPFRRTGHFRLLDLPSFIAFFKRFKSDNSLIYADTSGFPAAAPTFTAVFDDHLVEKDAGSKSAASWRQHLCSYTPVLSVEWKRWMAKDKAILEQEAFLEHLADNLPIIRIPEAAEILTLVEQLRGSVDVRFESTRNLFNGAFRLTYEEDVKMTGGTVAKQANMEVPSEIICAMAPFEFGQPYAVKNRLRYRVKDKKLLFSVEAMDIHKVLADAAAGMVCMIREETQTPVFMGKP